MYTVREGEQEMDERTKCRKVNKLIWVDTVGWDDVDLEGKKNIWSIIKLFRDFTLISIVLTIKECWRSLNYILL